ncbi:histidinol-phosphatase [Bosea sp. 2YAB26]|uniref:histidinol-phosphatase n=1 Tax=unclassified Bosea (in: a-proteobacteria) TaxID=2653178 RepID=UPI000853C044|nr:histidinol-phosphatase [Bosea sp. BIWAKO-01]GAU82883.1 histidinol-phosphatase [Bosea sp. BIWAKO-01]
MSAVDFGAFVAELATQSGQAILPFFRAKHATEDKSCGGVFDPVTEADRAGENVMRHLIKRNFPEHGVLGEEFGTENGEAEYVWVLDPIDGTRAFISGIPVWGTLIGLTREGVPVYGMMHQPFTGERYSGDGRQARYEGPGGPRVLRTRQNGELATATVMTTSPKLFQGAEQEAYLRVESAVRLARYGCDCYAYCMLASGHVDLVIESGLKPYDIVALIPIVEGAGGIVTSWDGGSAAKGGRIIAAANRTLHQAALALLAG